MLSIRMISVDFIVDNGLSLFIPKDWHHYLSGIIRIRSQVDLVKVIAMPVSYTHLAVTQMVSRLESKGLLIKVPNESNRQEMLLSLTRAGQKIYQVHQKQHAYLEKKVMAVLQAYPQDFLANLEAMMADLEKIWKGLPWLSR